MSMPSRFLWILASGLLRTELALASRLGDDVDVAVSFATINRDAETTSSGYFHQAAKLLNAKGVDCPFFLVPYQLLSPEFNQLHHGNMLHDLSNDKHVGTVSLKLELVTLQTMRTFGKTLRKGEWQVKVHIMQGEQVLATLAKGGVDLRKSFKWTTDDEAAGPFTIDLGSDTEVDSSLYADRSGLADIFGADVQHPLEPRTSWSRSSFTLHGDLSKGLIRLEHNEPLSATRRRYDELNFVHDNGWNAVNTLQGRCQESEPWSLTAYNVGDQIHDLPEDDFVKETTMVWKFKTDVDKPGPVSLSVTLKRGPDVLAVLESTGDSLRDSFEQDGPSFNIGLHLVASITDGSKASGKSGLPEVFSSGRASALHTIGFILHGECSAATRKLQLEHTIMENMLSSTRRKDILPFSSDATFAPPLPARDAPNLEAQQQRQHADDGNIQRPLPPPLPPRDAPALPPRDA
eukprot:gnl/TRDRNA2_/TRDRNA2_161324_c0_seq2.p1 gnl/TRDRNA2_/TRDRNA2_161324_c0~~gnl/TRDRNA2_/TRDRNA2_161324_c0_seq2.p1  ORF type:complete len:461 (-),score=66.28 gnl/TRDRNA2_/TRDRNA2_161324_c0_seq2:331-1713(-)